MQIAGDPWQVRRICAEQRRAARRVGFVPTMGGLHRGHLSLIQRARQLTDYVVVSIFVNPTQFCAGEDLERYPRDLAGDERKCLESGCDLLFCPSAAAVYPPGFQTRVEVEDVARGACGDRRPGHFRGVCTVVARLLNLVGPCTAVFGHKDLQQLHVIRRMVADLALPVQVVGAPTIREPDGLALSSRNAYLDGPARQAATCLHRALSAVRDRARQAPLTTHQAIALATSIIDGTPGARTDYVEVRHPDTFAPIDAVRPGDAVVLAAALVGSTRLIDNLAV